jgi:hypothetical protein
MAVGIAFGVPPDLSAQGGPRFPDAGEDLYRSACAACHGSAGEGLPVADVGFPTPLPDFTDCSFATREPNADWFAVIHQGGPVRAFDRMMPAFGEALSAEEIAAILAYVRGFCRDAAWPPGELNLPRAMFTEKAFPEDEAVWTTSVALDRPGSVGHELVYETRFGARNQLEFVLPFRFEAEAGEPWRGGIGDFAVGLKRAVYHSVTRGRIFSVAGEVILPTGNHGEGFGAGVTRVEPFVAFGQLLPREAFIQLQAGAELPLRGGRSDPEAFWRGVFGTTLTEGRFGRTWAPMVEVLGSRELTSGSSTHWDVAPQFQVTLSTRQHVRANLAARIPVTEASSRPTQLLIYLLLDWFDGGLFEGW